MRQLFNIPSVVPGRDATVYVVLDDFGQFGVGYRETDLDDADERTVIADLITGQFNNPIQIIAFNVAEGWCRDASEDIARAAARHAETTGKTLSQSAQQFFERHTGEDVPRAIAGDYHTKVSPGSRRR